jgi:hypothetical protein
MQPPRNHGCHPLQGSQVGGKAPGGGAFQERLDQGSARARIQARLATGSPRRPPPLAAATPPNPIPPAGRLPTDLEPMANRGRRVTLFKQVGGLHPAGFQGHKVPTRPKRGLHVPSVTSFLGKLTVL